MSDSRPKPLPAMWLDANLATRDSSPALDWRDRADHEPREYVALACVGVKLTVRRDCLELRPVGASWDLHILAAPGAATSKGAYLRLTEDQAANLDHLGVPRRQPKLAPAAAPDAVRRGALVVPELSPGGRCVPARVVRAVKGRAVELLAADPVDGWSGFYLLPSLTLSPFEFLALEGWADKAAALEALCPFKASHSQPKED